MEQVDWIPALAMLGVGVAIAVVLIWRSSRVAKPAPPLEAVDQVLDVRDETARLDALIGQLRELDDRASGRTPGQLAAERRALETDAARALRDLELKSEIPAIAAAQTVGSAVGRAEEVASAPSRLRGSGARGFLGGIATVVAVAGLVFLVTRAASDRAAGESPTGGTGMAAQESGGPMVDVDAMRRAVQQNPGNMAARLDLAQALLIARDFPGVLEQTEAVLKVLPDEPRALAYQAVVRVSQGEVDRALDMARKAVDVGGDNVETWVYLAIVHAQRGERAAASGVLEQAISRFPNEAPALQSLLAELRGAAPGAQAAPETQVPAGGVLIQVQLDPAAGARSGAVFVFARPAGGGDALAVRRSNAQGFPIEIGLLAADSMTGSLPPAMRIEARLDGDGDPSTLGPDDLVGFADEVQPGGVARVVLKKP
jgi:tetratricopeptide (TPR) repeat protein